QLAADALLHAVLVAVEDVAAVLALWLLALHVRVLRREARLEHLPQRDPEARQAAHQWNSSTNSPGLGIERYSTANASIAIPAAIGATTYQCQPSSWPTSSAVDTSTQRIAISIRYFHPSAISLSYRMRGRDARSHTVANNSASTLTANQKIGISQTFTTLSLPRKPSATPGGAPST